MMKIKNTSKRRIRIGKDVWINPSAVVDVPSGGRYLLKKHTELVNITPKPVRYKKPVEIQVIKKEIEVKDNDIE